MAKIFIIGSGGVGKSTIIKQLQARGYTAYDTDDMLGVTRLEDLNGMSVEWPNGYVDWNKYRWNWQRTAISKLLQSNSDVFIGAFPSNWEDFIADFDLVIAVSVDSTAHEHRLKTRNTHTHGQGEKNIAEQVYAQQEHLDKFLSAGAVHVVNDGPVDEIVNRILALSHVN